MTAGETNTIQKIGEPQISYQGKIHQIVLQVVQIGEKNTVFETAERAPGTRLIILRNDEILLTQEWRPEQEGWDYRLPGGKVFDRLEDYNIFRSTGKDIVEAAKGGAEKEAREEVGISVKNMDLYTKTACGATIGWDLYYFVINEFEELSSGQQLEEGESITTHWFKLEDVVKMCLNGEMREDRSVAVLLRYLHSIGKF